MTISDTLTLKTQGTAGVLALAEALERAGRAQAALGGSATSRIITERVAELKGIDLIASARVAASSKVLEIEAKGEEQLRQLRFRENAKALAANAKLREIDAKAHAQFQLNQQSAVLKLAQERAKQEGAAEKGAVRLQEKQLLLEKKRLDLVARREREAGLRERAALRSKGGKDEEGDGAAEALAGKRNMGVSAIIMGVKAGAAIGMAAAAASAEFAQAVIQAQAFREDVFEAFKIVAKTEDKALSLMQRANATADQLGMERAKIAGSFLDLTTKGFTENEVDRIVKSLGDIATIDPNASIEGLTKVIGKVKATGRLNQEVLNELSTFGLEQSDVIKEIGRLMGGKSDKDVLKALSSSGGIRDLGVEPILRAINAQVGGGKEGDAAIAKARRNMSSLIDQVMAIPSNLLFDLDVGSGTDRVKGALREIIDFFNESSDAGKETRRVLADTFNALAEGFFGVDTSGGITETLKSFVQMIADHREDIKTFAGDVRTVISAFASAVPVIASVASAIYNVFIGLPLDVISGLAYLPTALYDIGSNAMSALAGGITGAGQAVIDAVTGAVGGAIAWAKKLLGIASPSRVFMEIGAFTSRGFAQGVASNDNAIYRAAGAMAGTAVAGAANATFPAPSQGGGIVGAGGAAASQAPPSAGLSLTIGEVKVFSPKDEADAESMGRAFIRGAHSEFDSLFAASMRRKAG